MHQYQIKTSQKGDEWVASAMHEGNVFKKVYGMTRSDAINKLLEQMPPDERFSISHKSLPHGGGMVTVKDWKTGDVWTAKDSLSSYHALSELEKTLPKAYFKQTRGIDCNASRDYTEHHGFKMIVLPALIFGIIIVLFQVFVCK